jgi:hypothetical protein
MTQQLTSSFIRLGGWYFSPFRNLLGEIAASHLIANMVSHFD